MKGLINSLLILLLTVSFRAAIGHNGVDPGVGLPIKGIQKVSDRFGIIYTSDQLFRTDNGGSSWAPVPLPGTANNVISSVNFSSSSRGWAVMHDRDAESLVVAQTLDGGNSWSVKIAADNIFGEGVHLDEASLTVRSHTIALTFRIATSSNFAGRAVFSSNDDGGSWSLVERVIEIRSSDEPHVLRSADWSVVTDGSCSEQKRGCYQDARLVDGGGQDITPSAIKEMSRRAREIAERDAVLQPLLLPGGSVRTSLNRGFDKCTAGTISQMQTWWNNSPLYDANIYISGRNRGCSQAQLNANWVNQVSAMGWGLIPTIVGYQSPCITRTPPFTGAMFSLDPVVAEQQGRGEADIAVTDAGNLGLTAGSILYYDMERYDETGATPGCRVASTAFLKGWTERVRELGYRSGTYGSPRNAIDDWQFMAPASRMEAVWMARWDNVPSVWTYVLFSNFPNNVWDNHQRIKQWQAPHDETWGGVTFNIDGNIADGPVAGVAVAKNKNADFDGDRKADISVFRPDNGIWYVLNSASSTVSYTSFGGVGDIATPGDYDGDGRTDHAVFRPSDGGWHILTKGGAYTGRSWGMTGDIPVAADYNGDGKTDVAVFRPSNGNWYIVNSDSLTTLTFASWGVAGDKPVAGDYDGDGRSDIAVYRPSNGTWYIVKSSNGSFAFTPWGLSADLPAQGDFDADGKTDPAIYRPSTGEWYILRSSNGSVEYYLWGLDGDLPVTGEYDGDGKDDIAVFRPSNGGWYVQRSTGGHYLVGWGIATDVAVPNAYLPR